MKPPRRVKLGKLKPWTDEELERLSTITEQDKEAAAAHWHKNAGRLARLLDAEQQETGPDAKPNP